MRRREGGFTLTEMMVVVAMIAILAALAVSRFDTAPRAGDAAATMAALIRETARKAVGSNSPTRLVITNGDQITFSVERLVEEPETWTVLGTRTLPKGLEASGYTDLAVLDDGATPAVTLGTAEIRCYPDGVCAGATVYFQGRRGDRARVAVLPLGGAPITYRTW